MVNWDLFISSQELNWPDRGSVMPFQLYVIMLFIIQWITAATSATVHCPNRPSQEMKAVLPESANFPVPVWKITSLLSSGGKRTKTAERGRLPFTRSVVFIPSLLHTCKISSDLRHLLLGNLLQGGGCIILSRQGMETIIVQFRPGREAYGASKTLWKAWLLSSCGVAWFLQNRVEHLAVCFRTATSVKFAGVWDDMRWYAGMKMVCRYEDGMQVWGWYAGDERRRFTFTHVRRWTVVIMWSQFSQAPHDGGPHVNPSSLVGLQEENGILSQ